MFIGLGMISLSEAIIWGNVDDEKHGKQFFVILKADTTSKDKVSGIISYMQML